MRILLLAISAVTSLATGAVLLLPAGNVPAASPPAVHQAVAAVAVLPAASEAGQALASRSAPADHGTLAAVIRVKTVRVDPEGAEVQEQPAAPQARQPETSMVDPSTPSGGTGGHFVASGDRSAFCSTDAHHEERPHHTKGGLQQALRHKKKSQTANGRGECE